MKQMVRIRLRAPKFFHIGMSNMKPNIKVDKNTLIERHSIARALTECQVKASLSERDDLASKIQFETTKYLGGRSNLFPLTDPDSLFLGVSLSDLGF